MEFLYLTGLVLLIIIGVWLGRRLGRSEIATEENERLNKVLTEIEEVRRERYLAELQDRLNKEPESAEEVADYLRDELDRMRKKRGAGPS